jgi:hypothetical protein
VNSPSRKLHQSVLVWQREQVGNALIPQHDREMMSVTIDQKNNNEE